MNINKMRYQLKKAYGSPGGKWSQRVQKMPDDQVMAIYFRLLEKEPKRLRA